MKITAFAVASIVCLLAGTDAAAQLDVKDAPARLLAAHATEAQGYPAGDGWARPDVDVPFRWHSFRDDAIRPFHDAKMLAHVDPLNPLEAEGVSSDRGSDVTWRFVAEHVTAGKQALRVEFPAAAMRERRAVVQIKAVAGGAAFSNYLFRRGLMASRSCYGPHYRWIKLDAFNPAGTPLRLRICGVPMVVPPGRATIAVKTADAVQRGYACAFNAIPVEVVSGAKPNEDVVLFLDHVRMEQELPTVLSRRGRMLQFPGRAEPSDPPVVWPGFTPVETETLYSPERGVGWTQPAQRRSYHGHSFRSYENGILWGRCVRIDSPLRVDVPPGRWGVWIMAAPGGGFRWDQGGQVTINGDSQRFVPPRSPEQLREMVLGGERWDYRPGQCVWRQLVQPAFYPETEIVYADASDGHLTIELPDNVSLHAIVLFPADEKDAALAELGRLNFLLAESWDVSHPWVKGDYARQVQYIGWHDEMLRPESIPARIEALRLSADDYARGFVAFVRELLEPVYPDTIPAPLETAAAELRCFAAPGERECVTLGLLPLREVHGMHVTVSDLAHTGGSAKILAERIDVRVSRHHQKTMQFGHHNHDYNYQEHYLVRRPEIDLFPAAARRVYFDVDIPADAKPGRYTGRVSVLANGSHARQSVGNGPPRPRSGERGYEGTQSVLQLPLLLDVLPIKLETPRVFFAGSLDEPLLKQYGFNTFSTSYDRAIEHGYRGYLANLGYSPLLFRGERIGWSNVSEKRELLLPLIQAGHDGRGPRGFFGGPASGTHGKPNAAEIADRFFADVRRQFPPIDLLGRDAPAFFFREGKRSFQQPHEWIVLADRPKPDDPPQLAAAAESDHPFWFIDGLRHSKEHAARFTFGLWLWRIGASGRFTTLAAHLQYGYGTARESQAVGDPYFTLLDVNTCNVDRALMPSLTNGVLNPCRDLVLLRKGIDDYRYIETLERRLTAAAKKHPASPHVAAARKFLDQLRRELSPDLTDYYHARSGAYGENWTARDDHPWTNRKLDDTRRGAAELVLRLQTIQN